MRGSADSTGMPDVKSRPAVFRFEIVSQDWLQEMKLESTSDFFRSEMRAVRGPFFSMTFRHILSLLFLSNSSVAPFRGPNSDSRNGTCFATSRQASEMIAPEAPHSHADFLSIDPDSTSGGERCMKHTDHPVVHFLVHLMIFRTVRSRRSYAGHDDQFGHGQNTGLGWSDPTFVHGSVPKVIRGVAPAQLRIDRAQCFVRSAFCSRRPQQ
jgi:hypothetical protein